MDNRTIYEIIGENRLGGSVRYYAGPGELEEAVIAMAARKDVVGFRVEILPPNEAEN